MASYEQLPGKMNVAFKGIDGLSVALDFNPTTFTGVTLSAAITSVVNGSTVATPTVTVTNAGAGQCNVSLPGSQAASIPAGTYAWELWAVDNGARRTYLTGFVEVTR